MNDELKQAVAEAICCGEYSNGCLREFNDELLCLADHRKAQAALDAIEAQGVVMVQWPPAQEQFDRAYHDTNWPKPTALPRKQTLREFYKAMVQAGKVK